MKFKFYYGNLPTPLESIMVQKGIRSRGFRGPLWSEQEIRLRHYQEEVDRYVNGEK